MKPRSIKIGIAGLAYVPILVLVLVRQLGVYPGETVVTACVIFNLPALSMLEIVRTYQLSNVVEVLLGLSFMVAWASLIAWFLWRLVGAFQGDDEPDDQRGKYDWVGFQMRFAIGFVIGCLIGWRFVKYSTSMTTLLTASLITGCFCGLLYGLTRPPNFWSRP